MDIFDEATERMRKANVPPADAKKYLEAWDSQLGEWRKEGLSPAESRKRLEAINLDHQDASGQRVVIKPFAPETPEDVQFRKEGQRQAIEEPAFKALSRAVIPTLAGLATLHPGVGMAASAAIGGGATGLNQLLGQEPYDPTAIAIGAGIPLVAGGVAKALKASTKGAAELLNPGELRSAGVDVAAGYAGLPKDLISRISSITPQPSKAAYEAARRIGPIPTTNLQSSLVDTITKLEGHANPPKGAIKYLENMLGKFMNNPQLQYADVMDELQQLRLVETAALKKNPVLGKAINEARRGLVQSLDDIAPAIKEANALYAKEASGQELLRVMRSSGDIRSKLNTLLEEQPEIAANLKLGKSGVTQINNLAAKLSDVASAAPTGMARQIWSAITEPAAELLATPKGRSLLKWSLSSSQGKPQVTAAAINSALQYYRVSEARIEADKIMKSPTDIKTKQEALKKTILPQLQPAP